MTFVETVGELLLTEWLWGITWGMWHTPCSLLMMFMLFTLYGNFNKLSAFGVSVAAHLFSWAVFSFIVLVGFLGIMGYFGVTIAGDADPETVASTLATCFMLGSIHALLQTLFYSLINCFYRLDLLSVITMVWISNLSAAWVVDSLLQYYA